MSDYDEAIQRQYALLWAREDRPKEDVEKILERARLYLAFLKGGEPEEKIGAATAARAADSLGR